jgi:hypothetical protein
VFSAFDFAYGEDEGEDSKEHLVSLANVGRELRSMGIDFED